jgi:hypothetical protein
MRPMAAAAVGALVAGVGMYAVGTRAQQDNPFAEIPALVQTVDGRFVQIPDAKPLGYVTALQPAAPVTTLQPAAPAPAPVVVRQRPAPTQTVYRTTEPARTVQERVVVERAPEEGRSWGKTALIVGGSAASGAGVGAVVGGKKGALAGAAIGGGAASIYEATRRR